MRYVFGGAILLLGLFLVLGENDAGEKKGDKKGDAKITISQVMKKVMGPKLFVKVASGKASDAEKKTLAEYLTALSKTTPPKGDPEAWKKHTGEMAEAAQKAAKGDTDAAQELVKLINCGSCHGEYKGKKKKG